MTRASLAVFTSLILLVASRLAMAQAVGREDAVRAAVSAFGRAFVEADVSVLETLLTVDYVHVNGRPGTVLNRDEWLKWIESRRTDLDSGGLRINACSIEDVKVQFHGEAAVVTGVADLSGQRQGAFIHLTGAIDERVGGGGRCVAASGIS